MKPALLLVALFCLGMFPSGARAQLTACCSITAIDAATAIVSAKVNSSGAGFQFKVTDAKSLQSVRVGQGIYANLTTKQVSLDGKSVCCSMIAAPQVPVSAPATKTTPPSATATSAANAAHMSIPASAPKTAVIPPPSTTTVVPQTSTPASAPKPIVPPAPNTTTFVPPVSSTSGSVSTQVVTTLAAPANLRITQSLDQCRQYGGGGLAGVGCAAAMQNHWYILIWDWTGPDAAITGFNVYQGGNTPPSSLRGPVTQLAQKPIQTNSQHPLVRLAVFDPKQVGTNACFTVTAYANATESARSPQTCVTAANAAAPVFKSVTLTPTRAAPLPTQANDALTSTFQNVAGLVQFHFAFPDRLNKAQNDDLTSIPAALTSALPPSVALGGSPLHNAPLWQQFDALWSSVSAQDCATITSDISGSINNLLRRTQHRL